MKQIVGSATSCTNTPVGRLFSMSRKTLRPAGTGQVSVQTNSELQRLQQEVELLRLKDVQQEHHIQVLTQQLRSSQPLLSQVEQGLPRCLLTHRFSAYPRAFANVQQHKIAIAVQVTTFEKCPALCIMCAHM